MMNRFSRILRPLLTIEGSCPPYRLTLSFLACVFLAVFATAQPQYPEPRQLPDHPVYGYGTDGDLVVASGQTQFLYRDMEFDNVTVESDGVLDTRGYTLKVREELINYGTITDGRSGGAGGDKGAGGRGADPLGSGPTYAEDGEDGQPGEAPSHPDAGRGGHGGAGGGGGGGAKRTLPENVDANGGDGSDGADGGKGGGFVEISAYCLYNYGTINADGEDGQDVDFNGEDGEYYKWWEFVGGYRDLTGGGGGSGSGGSGGDGGTVRIVYALLVNPGQIRANGGAAGKGKDGGEGTYLDYGVEVGAHTSGAEGGYPGGGDGGDGEHRENHSSDDGQPGADGSPGAAGTVDLAQVSTPIPDVKVNGEDDDFSMPQGQTIKFTVSLDPGDYEGATEKWWIFASNSQQTWWWIWPGSWIPGPAQPAITWPLTPVTNVVVGEAALPAGTWSFDFAIDDDGLSPFWYADDVEVYIY